MRNKAYDQWKRQMLLAAKKTRTPILVHFELTPRCNLDCKMCYIHNADSNAMRDRELSTEQWKKIFDDAYACGMLFADLSGGECLLRSDFKELYLYLWNKRVMITVMSNGTLLNDDYLEFFKKYPPADVQISLYGSSEEVYLQVTGHHGFEKAVYAIRSLTDAHIPVSIATTPSSYIKEDLVNLRKFCKENKFWCGPVTFNIAQNRDNPEKDDHYLTESEIIELSRALALLDGPVYPVENTPEPCGNCCEAPHGLKCTAGICAALITWEGIMHPCPMLPVGTVSLQETSYEEAWKNTQAEVDKMRLGMECVGCPYDGVCTKCPAFRLQDLYSGHCNPVMCEMTRKMVAIGAKKLPR